MAGPSVVVRVLGDVKGLGDSFKAAGDTASGAVEKIHGAFSSVLGTLNQTGVLGGFGEALDGIDGAFEKIIGHGKDVGTAMLGVGGALVGVGAGLQAIGSKDQAAHQQLQAAVEATGKDYDDYAEKVDAAIKHQEKFGDTANTTQDALRTLTQATHDPQKALDLLGTAANIAAAKHEDLNTAAGQLGKVYNGNTKLLKEYGISIDKTTGLTNDGKTATQALADVTAGQASAAADTFAGKMRGIKAAVEDSAAAFGQKYGPAITAAGGVVTALGAAWQVATGIKEGLTAATDAGAAADDAAAVSEGIALAPILLIIAAVAVLGVALYELVTHWSTVWDACKAAVEAVWDWIKTNWPLLLDILLGPIGLAVGQIIQHWDTIKNAAVGVFNWIRDNWPLLLAIITGPFGLAVLEIERNWDSIMGFFKGIPNQMAGIFADIWHPIVGAFEAVLNGVIDLWNSLHFTLPKIDLGPLGKIGGGDIGVPHIPHLAQGGLITASGIVFAHAGEVITPAPQAARGGPALTIGVANFHDDADVDTLMRQTEFAVAAGRF